MAHTWARERRRQPLLAVGLYKFCNQIRKRAGIQHWEDMIVNSATKSVLGARHTNRPVTPFISKLLIAATIGAYLTFAIIAFANTHNRVGLGGAPLFYDFSVFYQAASIADAGNAASAYDDKNMVAAVKNAFPGSTLRLPWNYPPTFQLLLMPLGALPYVVAWLVWSCGLYVLYSVLARKLIAQSEYLWIVLLAPGAAVNLFFGQNGLLSFVLISAGVFMLKRRPVFGGAVLGMIAYKPQLALIVPLVLIFGREWRALAAAAAGQVLLAVWATVALGANTWVAFANKLLQPSTVFSSSSSDWRAIPSVMILAKSLGLNPEASTILHWVIASLAAGAAMWIWSKNKEARIRAAALGTAALLVTPYLRGYDLALLVLPIMALLPYISESIWGRSIIFLAWLLPAILMFTTPKIQFGALVSIGMMSLLVWYCAKMSETPGMAKITVSPQQ
jgi:hypothetical protein